MNSDILENLTDPAVLFFFLGIVVGLIRSNLEVPAPVAKFLSLYLLMALGFKGGQELSKAGLSGEGAKVLGAAIFLALVIPGIWFLFLRKRINSFDAAAIAATYGSVSAVTFVTASQFVAARGDEAGGHMTVALALMESPAIIMAVFLATWVRSRLSAESLKESEIAITIPVSPANLEARALIPESDHAAGARPSEENHSHSGTQPISVKEVLREAFTDGAHLLLIGSMVIGAISGEKGGEVMAPFVGGMFKGFLAFFLLEMGLLVARQLREVRDVGPFLIGFGAIVPFVNAALAMTIGWALGLDVGDLTLLTVLAASGSYIVVPAVVRYAIPEARPSRYLTLALAVTFPINMAIGIPLYYAIASAISG
ncbi:MAG: sodium-dependent bicarbonate transport family permease [Actinomycetes bacterium]